VTGEVLTSVPDGSLDAFTAFLHGGIGQTDDDDGGRPVGVVHFDLDDDAFEANGSTGWDAS
jgi:hypothetical protein